MKQLGAPTLIPRSQKASLQVPDLSCAFSCPLKSESWLLHSNPPHTDASVGSRSQASHLKASEGAWEG